MLNACRLRAIPSDKEAASQALWQPGQEGLGWPIDTSHSLVTPLPGLLVYNGEASVLSSVFLADAVLHL